MTLAAMQVSTGFAVWWTLGAVAVGALLMWWLYPPVSAWLLSTLEAARHGLQWLMTVLGGLALVAGLIFAASYIH